MKLLSYSLVRPAILFLALNAGLLPFIVKAQYNHFEKISEQQGLSDNRVTCFKKDRTGFLWIGTENGLNRYDGFSFRIYRPGQKQFNLSHEHINDIEEDHEGRFWIATWYGLNLLDTKTDSLTIFSPDLNLLQQSKTRLSSSLIWDTYVDDNRLVWIAPDSRDLCCYDPSKQEFSYYPWRDFLKSIRPNRQGQYTAIQKILRKSDHELWLGTTAGLFSFDCKTKTFKYYGGEDPEDCVSLQYDAEHHRVYLGQKRLYMLDEVSQKMERISYMEKSQYPVQLKSSRLISTATGLWAIDGQSLNAWRVSLQEKSTFSLHHEKVNTVYDDQGIVWIGATDGIRIYDRRLNIFHFTAVFADTTYTLAGNIHHVLDHEQDQCYYISAFNFNRLIILDKLTGAQKIITHIEGKPLTECSMTYEDSKGRLWILSRHHIFISDPSHKKFSIFRFPKEDYYQYMDMTEDVEGNFWFASLHYGIFQYNPTKQTWKLFEEKDGLFAVRATALLSNPTDRTVWIGDYSYGAFRYKNDSAKFSYFGMHAQDTATLQSSLINDLALDRQGAVWVATSSGGVSKFSNKDQSFKTFLMKDGLRENTINNIQADRAGNIWLGSFKGLTCMAPDGKIIRHYDKNAGLPFTGFSTPITMNARGELLVGIAHGFIRFHPDSLRIETSNFPVIISDAKQGNQHVEGGMSPVFPYHQNEFQFEFAALTYTLPGQVTYYYKLDGYDHEWINAGNLHTARYTNLGEGEYIFQVKAIDHSGRPSDNVATLSFIIKPPFWKEAWFIGLLIVAGLFGLYSWRRKLQQKIKSQQILNQVATSLYNKSTLEDVFWAVSKNCVELLHFEDCVVYMLQSERNILIQKAAAGPKSNELYQIINPIEIPMGQGIVGHVAQTGKAEIIRNTARDKRYIVDDQQRLSEIAVPIFVEGKVFGVIDSEHRQKNFYSKWHLNMLQEIATICSSKIGRYFAEDQIRSKVARDLHDDMGSTLSSIKIMSNIALQKNEPVLALNYLKTIRQNATAMQESMSDMVWAINPENDNLEQVIIRMKEFSAEILEPLNIQYAFYEDGDFTHIKLDLNTRKDFYLIFKEAINNAAKYSLCTAVMIHLHHNGTGIDLSIEDNGKGFDTAVPPSGNGLRNMKYRAQAIAASLSIESAIGKGTLVKVEIQSHDRGI
jgi:signal transduction histidine kinase/ligand-binding sensor domain-containing protein